MTKTDQTGESFIHLVQNGAIGGADQTRRFWDKPYHCSLISPIHVTHLVKSFAFKTTRIISPSTFCPLASTFSHPFPGSSQVCFWAPASPGCQNIPCWRSSKKAQIGVKSVQNQLTPTWWWWICDMLHPTSSRLSIGKEKQIVWPETLDGAPSDSSDTAITPWPNSNFLMDFHPLGTK